MLAIFSLAALVAGSFLESAIAWLRYLSSIRTRRRRMDTIFPRFILPTITALLPILITLIVASEPPHPFDSSPQMVGVALFFGVVLVAQVARVIVEARRYRARPREVLQDIQTRSPTRLI